MHAWIWTAFGYKTFKAIAHSLDPMSHHRESCNQFLQACAAELTRAHHVWSQVLASDTVEAFQHDPNGAVYLQALQQVWLVALLLQAAAELHQIDEHRAPRWHHAFAEASRQSLAKITGRSAAMQPCQCCFEQLTVSNVFF